MAVAGEDKGGGVGVAVAREDEGDAVLEAPLTESEGGFDAVEGGSPDRRAANRRAACRRRRGIPRGSCFGVDEKMDLVELGEEEVLARIIVRAIGPGW